MQEPGFSRVLKRTLSCSLEDSAQLLGNKHVRKVKLITQFKPCHVIIVAPITNK